MFYFLSASALSAFFRYVAVVIIGPKLCTNELQSKCRAYALTDEVDFSRTKEFFGAPKKSTKTASAAAVAEYVTHKNRSSFKVYQPCGNTWNEWEFRIHEHRTELIVRRMNKENGESERNMLK